MASLKDAAERQAFSLAIDATLKSLNKDREKGLLNIVNLAQKFMEAISVLRHTKAQRK